MKYFFILLFVICNSAFGATHTEYFIATTGSDSNAGTISAPFLTLEKAAAQIVTDGLPSGGTTVWLRGGTYYRNTTLTLVKANSGSSVTDRITYRGYPQEVVRILGSRELTGFVPVTDSAILARLSASAQANVLQLNIGTNHGSLSVRGYGIDEDPLIGHSELYYDGRRMTLAQFPNSGTWTNVIATGGALASGFTYNGIRPNSWVNPGTNVWVYGYWNVNWADSYQRVNTINTNTKAVTTYSPYGTFAFTSGQRFYWLNILEELDSAGEYYIDYATNILYFWPPSPAKETRLSDDRISMMLYFSGSSNITFRSIIFEQTCGRAAYSAGEASINFQGCLIRNIGLNALELYGNRDTVEDCDIEDIADAGIIIKAGTRSTLTRGDVMIRNNHFTRQGSWSRTYVPAVGIYRVGNTVTHNLMEYNAHEMVHMEANDSEVSWNDISFASTNTSDAGVFYGGGDWSLRGDQIKYNYFHGFTLFDPDINTAYLDDWLSGHVIYGNIFNGGTHGAYIGGGRDNLVMNNIFISNSTAAIHLDERGVNPIRTNEVWTTRKTYLSNMPSNTFRAAYPLLTNVDNYYNASPWAGIPAENNVIATNIMVGGVWTVPNAQYTSTNNLIQSNNYNTGGDPLFVDSANGNFHLQSSSPALALGFVDIPVERIGMYNSDMRNELAFIKAHVVPGPPARYATSPTVRVGTMVMP